LTALFLKDLIQVYEVERDDPPAGTQLTFTPDNRFAVEQIEEGEPGAIGVMILDALFKYQPALGGRVLAAVRYTTRTELEETAFENKTRRLEIHGFVDYYEAISIYAGPAGGGHKEAARENETEAIPGEESPGNLPAVFADSLAGGTFLLQAFGRVTDPAESDRFAQELTALGNRILSANLVNLGELEGVRPALEEMRDFLTIGLESLTAGRADLAVDILRKSYIQSIFKAGFDQVARLRDLADRLTRFPKFNAAMLDPPDQEFIEAIRRFKPLLIEHGRYRNFQNMADVERARARLASISGMVVAFFSLIPAPEWGFGRTFKTAVVQMALTGSLDPVPVRTADLEALLRGDFRLPDVDVPPALQPFRDRWLDELREELSPLRGKTIDRRFVEGVALK
jgi:hypothetical protein